MRRLTMAFLFCLTGSIANAQPSVQLNKPVTCNTFNIVTEELSKTYKEEPNWTGNGTYTKYIMFVDPKTQSWTLVEYSDNGIACIIGTGEQSTLLRFGTSI